MRNVFDQYEQPENRLTHALATVLDRERSLLIPFLRWLGIQDTPSVKHLAIAEQQVPGLLQEDAELVDQKGLPDIAIFNEDGWAVFIESKVQARVSLNQLDRHRRTARRHGVDSPWIVALSVDEFSGNLPERMIAKTWRELYAWICEFARPLSWAKELQIYMQVFERKMIAEEYAIRGTITVFDGFKFDEENP